MQFIQWKTLEAQIKEKHLLAFEIKFLNQSTKMVQSYFPKTYCNTQLDEELEKGKYISCKRKRLNKFQYLMTEYSCSI